jgi:hypothetical protein
VVIAMPEPIRPVSGFRKQVTTSRLANDAQQRPF